MIDLDQIPRLARSDDPLPVQLEQLVMAAFRLGLNDAAAFINNLVFHVQESGADPGAATVRMANAEEAA